MATQRRRQTSSQPYTTVGRPVETIPVHISYRIIELFSAGLYRSPHKAIEELISNSYDALAEEVRLFLPPNLASSGASIWVVDDGESMDLQGLIDLWQIAKSPKEHFRDDGELARAPIGKFGIGKLATYVLARKLTYLCKKDGVVRAVTMDYSAVDQDADTDTVRLEVREVDDTDDLAAALQPLKQLPGGITAVRHLLEGPGNWTVATMSDLKPPARDIKVGRLEWILSTALPMSPAFRLWMNGRRIRSTVEDRTVLAEWAIGEPSDDLPDVVEAGKDDAGLFVEVEGLTGKIRGSVRLVTDVLTKNKASDWGRSHGFFVKVRGRLVNLDDSLFGLPELSHATFNRFRLEVNADGLDAFMASTRESIKDAPPVDHFRDLLRAEFNRARVIYDNWVAKEESRTHLSTRIGNTAASTSRAPLVNAVRSLIDGEVKDLLLIQTPTGLDDAGLDDLVSSFEESLSEDDGESLIAEVKLEPLGPDRFVASYDPVTRVAYVNTLHPFFANFIEGMGQQQPFEMLAV